MRLYFDSSALVKLVQVEAESESLRDYLRAHRADERVASELARVEVVRAVLSGGAPTVARARRELGRFILVKMNREILERAATLAPESLLRSLDAIHLATAQTVGNELRALVSYDARMLSAAAMLRLPTESPR